MAEDGRLLFRLAQLRDELDIFRRLAKDFISDTTIYRLEQFRTCLEGATRAERPVTLELVDLKTRPTVEYEKPPREGGRRIYAVISGIWKIAPVDQRTKKQGKIWKRRVEFCGIASTRIAFHDADDDSEIAMWRNEFGDTDSPGSYFHVQIRGQSNEGSFPKSVPVPRLPTPFVTPLSAVEFVLGELFQESWGKSVASKTDLCAKWSSMQAATLRAYFGWQADVLGKVGEPTPWLALKTRLPASELFLKP